MSGSGIGRSFRRSEDLRLVTGRGRFVDDEAVAGAAHAVFVRSPHGHARILGVDIAGAEAMPGVLAVLTGHDLAADGVRPLPCTGLITNADGSAIALPERPALVSEVARHAGDAVAMVVAETALAARAAADAVLVDYDPLPAAADPAGAVEEGAPRIWDDAPGNVCFDWEAGDRQAADAAFAGAGHVVALDIVNNRVVPTPLEPRGAIGEYDTGSRRYTLTTSTQGSHLIRRLLARDVLGVPENRIRVITRDVGGGFGMKMYLYPEQVLVLWAARRLGRPVRWTADRGESFLTDSHGRDHRAQAELALDNTGRFLAVRVSVLANLGAYLSTLAPFIPTMGGVRSLTGPYRLPAVHVRVRGVFTNTAPVDAYRGAGRPEYSYVTERLVGAAARRLGVDPAELRRTNFVGPDEMPYRTALGQLYDSGDFARNLDDALSASDWPGRARRKREAKKRGMLRGIGLCSYVEPCGGNRDQYALLAFDADGSATLGVGAQATGQGHETGYAQILADRLGLAFEKIRVVEGDTDAVAHGAGSSGSRSMPIGGSAVALAAGKAIEKGRLIAAREMEVSAQDVEFSGGRYVVAGTDRSLAFEDTVRIAFARGALPEGMEPGMHFPVHFDTRETTYPNGTHVAEVEIDPETGRVAVTRYVAVDDFGVIVNPMMVAGQVHGGVAQGLGQALLEWGVYDEDGQLVTGSLQDYALPRADDLPMLDVSTNEVPCRTNVLGVKGCGEAGCVAAPAVVIDAVLDALAPYGVTDIDMPATACRIWQLIEAHRV